MDNGGECLSVVDVVRIGEPPSNYMSLVLCNSTIKMILQCELPLARDNINIFRIRF